MIQRQEIVNFPKKETPEKTWRGFWCDVCLDRIKLMWRNGLLFNATFLFVGDENEEKFLCVFTCFCRDFLGKKLVIISLK